MMLAVVKKAAFDLQRVDLGRVDAEGQVDAGLRVGEAAFGESDAGGW